MLMYRTCRCCRRIWNKLLHALFHLLAMPCIAMGFIAVLDSHNERVTKNAQGELVPDPIPNFYSLHSWMGLATMGLFGLQVIKNAYYKKKILLTLSLYLFIIVCSWLFQLFALIML